MREPLLTTTAFGFDGYRIAQHLGLVRGIIVRSRSIVGNIGAVLQTLVGGNISIYTELCERARQDAYQSLCDHAIALGRQRHYRRALRCDRDRARRDRSALLRNGRGG
jgi:uncharacterized protein YbjQ (UPF0145 family)